jgi:class 3 adenylate cyclase/tetratricopeptide (TPR) repeat protein
MICPTCQTANAANARFCQNCGQPLARICANCGAINPPNARFCNQCGTPLTEVASAPVTPPPAADTNGHNGHAAQAEQTESVALRALAEESKEQRRVVTVLFADLTSSTELADGMDPEDVRTLLSAFFATMTREIRRHGGTVEKYIGDAVMAVFGLPVAHEDDPVRAVRAALDMQAALRHFNAERRAADGNAAELHMRIGVNTGDVAASGAAGDGRDFLITGDPVNVASRLQSLAEPGTVLVGPRTHRATSGAVRYRALPNTTIRGKTRALKVWEALEITADSRVPAPRPRGLDGLRAPLVGRDVELELMDALFDRVRSERRPHLVTILGAPGVGKTRLAREFIQRSLGAPALLSSNLMEDAAPASTGPNASNPAPRRPLSPTMTVEAAEAPPLLLEGRCPVYGEGITYWPLAEMLRSYCGFGALDSAETSHARLLLAVTETLRLAGKPDDPESVAAMLAHTIGLGKDAEDGDRRMMADQAESGQVQEGILRAWRVFFEAVAARRSLLVLVEDIHWADDLLLDLLEYVAAKASNTPLLLLCTARPELLERRPDWGGGKRNYALLSLEALSRASTNSLVNALLPGDGLPEELRQGILEKVEGNPFYIEEIIHMLVDRGLIAHDRRAGWRVAPEFAGSAELADPAIPDTIQGVLLARLDLLEPQERDILQHAAVMGRYFWSSALRTLAPHLATLDLDAALMSLQRKDLIRVSEYARHSVAPAGEPVYAFNHNLTREVVYSTIVRTRRAHEHARVAELIEELARGREEEFAELLAQHYQQYYLQANLARSRNAARRQAVRAKALHYLTLAGDRAAARHATAQAERFYGEALSLPGAEADEAGARERVDLLMRRGDARRLALHIPDAWYDYHDALEIWSTVGPSEEPGERPTSDGEEHTRLADEWRRRGVRLYTYLVLLPTRNGGVFHAPPSHDELLAYLEQGLQLAESCGGRESAEYAWLLTARSFFWWSWPEQRGERELLEALRSAREAARILEALDDPLGVSEALDGLGNILAATTDLRGYLDSQRRRLAWVERIEEPIELVDMYSEASLACHLVGEYAEAVEHAQTALRLAEATEVEASRTQALRSAVLAWFEWDSFSEALTLGRQLRMAATHVEVVASHRHAWAILALAIAAARTGVRDDTPGHVRREVESMLRTETDKAQYLEVYRGRLALARGATDEARDIFLSALDYRSGRQGLAPLLAELAELGARTGDTALYERFGAQALELGWRSGARKSLAQATRARSIVAIGEERFDDAMTDVENALQIYQSLGTTWEEARTRYVLAGLYRRRGSDGDAACAQTELARALALFDALRAVRDIARARAALAGGDIRLP